jgi:hypothetical protein
VFFIYSSFEFCLKLSRFDSAIFGSKDECQSHSTICQLISRRKMTTFRDFFKQIMRLWILSITRVSTIFVSETWSEDTKKSSKSEFRQHNDFLYLEAQFNLWCSLFAPKFCTIVFNFTYLSNFISRKTQSLLNKVLPARTTE